MTPDQKRNALRWFMIAPWLIILAAMVIAAVMVVIKSIFEAPNPWAAAGAFLFTAWLVAGVVYFKTHP